MEYYGNTLCISARELIGNGIMSEPNYKQLSARGRIDVVRRGGRSGYALGSGEKIQSHVLHRGKPQ